MSIKDLFKDYKSNQFKPSESELSSSKLVESSEFIENKYIERNAYVPPIDFSTASNFAKFGSSELYYEFAFKRIYQQYPYDGSLAEKQIFRNNSTFLDRYIFDNVYPKTAGHVIFSSDGWGSQTSQVEGYGLSNNIQYISVLGGPHTASGGMVGKDLAQTFENSMIYDETKSRVGSFEWDPLSGSTIEFWMKKDEFLPSSLTDKEVILDIWNQELSSSNSYGRIRLELTGTTGPIRLTMMSGANGFQNLNICPASLTQASVADGNWHHYAISIESFLGSSPPVVSINLYKDGRYINTVTNSNPINSIKHVTGGVNAYIGALRATPSGNEYHGASMHGAGKLSASLDEFRYWKKKRTTNEIGEFWFINMGGGTNKREYNTDLGVYFKFNEGITGDSLIDDNILDYSGRISNGLFVGYTATARSTVSAMDTALTNVVENKDPIIYSSHPIVSASLNHYKSVGKIQDFENTSLLYHLFPSWIIETDEESGKHLKYLTQIMASYFDTLNSQIQSVTEFKDKRYFSGSLEPNIYSRELLRNHGFVVPDLFIEADVLEEFRSKDRNEIFTGDINKIKNKIYQNIYNNLDFIYKSKGTEKSFRNLFRCFGVDSELLKLNLYSDGSTYLYRDNYEFASIAKPVVNLNKEAHLTASVYQSGSDGRTYLQGSESDDEENTSITLECEVLFPYKFERFETGYYPTDFTIGSIAGFHRAVSDPTDFSFHGTDTKLGIFAVKENIDSNHVTFKLSGAAGAETVDISTPVFKEVYDNNKWILAARVKHEDYPFAGNVTGSAGTGNYIVELYGVNSVANDVRNEFTISASVSNTAGKAFLGHLKRVYAGAHKENFTGTTLQRSDVKISQVRFWQSYLENNEIREHSYDPTNYGLIHPYRPNSIFAVPGITTYVPKIETLALHWDFSTVTTSDSGGNFIVNDVSSGSVSDALRYSVIGKITKNKHDGRGIGFIPNSVDAVDKEFIYAAKKRLPDEVYSSDGVVIKTEENEAFFEDDAVADHFYSFEKSPYNAVSQQMINFFGSMKDFNSLVGDPAERYRPEYKQMTDLKRLFFERVENTPDPERFFEYFKWIDTSISYAIKQLIPASSKFSGDVKDVVESHILERNKFQEKFPLTAQERATEGVVKSFSEMFYNWKFGHAPLDGSDNKNCLWQKTRRRVDNTEVQQLRDNIYKTSNAKLDRLYDEVTEQVYFGKTDATRRLSRPYKLELELKQNIHGGINYYVGKDRDYALEVAKPHGPTSGQGIPKNVLVVGVGAGQGLIPQTVCEDDEDNVINKEKYTFDGLDGRFSSDQNNAPISDFESYKNFTKGIRTFPFNIMSQSSGVSTGYQSVVTYAFKDSAYITNLHSDTTDRSNAVPMQGPFTETHVGGHQSRHVRLNKHDTTLFDADFGGTPRFYRAIGATKSTGKIVVNIAGVSDGADVSISDGTNTVVFEIDKSSDGVGAGRTAVLTGSGGAAGMGQSFSSSIDSSVLNFSSVSLVVNTSTQFTLFLTASDTGPSGLSFAGGATGLTPTVLTTGITSSSEAFFRFLDNEYTRPESWRLLFGENPNEPIVDGALGLVPPDYGVTAGTGKYPDTAKHRASYYREERIKRPVNIKNIKHKGSGSIGGNYNNNYEIMLLQGRTENNLYYRDNSDVANYLPTQYISDLGHTTHVMGLYGIDPTQTGNIWGVHANNRQPDRQLISEAIPGTPATGSFVVTGSTITGLSAAGSFTFERAELPEVSASISFSAKGRTVSTAQSKGSFVVTGSRYRGLEAEGTFKVARPEYVASVTGSFTVVGGKEFAQDGDSVLIRRGLAGFDPKITDHFFFVNSGGTGSFGHNISTGSSDNQFYNNLKNSITTNTVYTDTTFSETSAVIGKGVANSVEVLGPSLSGKLDETVTTQGPFSMAFWLYLSSSTTKSGDIFVEEASLPVQVKMVRRISIDYDNVADPGSPYLRYDRFFHRGHPNNDIVTASVRQLIPAQNTDRWIHVTITQVGSAATSGRFAVPGYDALGLGMVGGMSIKQFPSFEGASISNSSSLGSVDDDEAFNKIAGIPATMGNYTFFTNTNSLVDKALPIGLDEPAIWNTTLDLHAQTALANNGLYRPRNYVSSSNLKAWWRFGDDGLIASRTNPYDSDNDTTLSNGDLLFETINNQHATASESADGHLSIVDAITLTASTATFTVRKNLPPDRTFRGFLSAGNSTFPHISPSAITGSLVSSDITQGDTISIQGEVFELDPFDSASAGNHAVLFKKHAEETPTTFYNRLSQSIKNNTDFDTISITDLGVSGAQFRLTASVVGDHLNLQMIETGSSFSSLSGMSGGQNPAGAEDGHHITINGTRFELDVLGNGVEAGQNINAAVGVTNTDFWNSLSNSIVANTAFDDITITDQGDGSAKFSITASSGGSSNNGSITASGASFSSLRSPFGGVDASGSSEASWIELTVANSEDYRFHVDNDGGNVDGTPANNFYVTASTATDVEWWNNLSQSIKDRGFGVSYTSDGNGEALFTVTTFKTASAGNTITSNSSVTNHTAFNFVLQPDVIYLAGQNRFHFAGGLDKRNGNEGHQITIDGVTFEMDSDGSVTGSNIPVNMSGTIHYLEAFNNLTASIKANTDFDIIKKNGAGFVQTIEITSSVTGSAKNGVISGNTGKFTSFVNTSGGTDETGADDGDTITIDGVVFELDNDSSVTGTNVPVGCSGSFSNATFWNNLSNSIKAHTVYDTVTITSTTSHATFELTSSTTGSALNVPIIETGDSFTSPSGFVGGTDFIPAVYSDIDVVLAVPTPTLRNGDKNKTVIATRFSAPGGIEIESPAYLDVYAREYSVHNGMPFRNLTVKHDSGEPNQIRINDHLNKRRGLNTLLSNHSGRFGLDPDFGVRRVTRFSHHHSRIYIGTASKWDAIIGNNSSGGSTQKMTLAAWVNLEGLGEGTKGRFFDFGNDLAFFVDNSLGLRFHVKRTGENLIEWQAPGILTLNTWFHVAVTYDGNDIQNDPIIYLNAVSQSTSLLSGEKIDSYYGIVGQSCYIGNRAFGPFSRAHQGKMSDAAIWNRVLPSSDIEMIYNAGIIEGLGSVVTDVDENLQLWYKLGGNSDTRTTFFDESGNGRESDARFLDFTNYIDETQASFHKTHRNTSYTLISGSSESYNSLKGVHNNAFFSTPIPASDFQYSWIVNTLGIEYGIDSGQQKHYRYSPSDGIISSSSGITEAIIFPDSSDIT